MSTRPQSEVKLSPQAKRYKEGLEKYQKDKLGDAKLFDPAEATAHAGDMKHFIHEKLGIVLYGMPTWKEVQQAAKLEKEEERSVEGLYLMLRKAYPNITKSDILSWGIDTFAPLSATLGKELTFLAETMGPLSDERSKSRRTPK